MTKEESIARANALKNIVEDDFYQEAVESIRLKLLEKFEQSKPADREKRESIHRSLALLKVLNSTLETAIAEGDVAKKQINALANNGVKNFF